MKVFTVASLLATRAAAGVMGFALGIYALSILVVPGPDYKFYLSPKFVDTDAALEELKRSIRLVDDVKTFENFVVPVDPAISPIDLTTVVIWCETFREFITAAKYQ